MFNQTCVVHSMHAVPDAHTSIAFLGTPTEPCCPRARVETPHVLLSSLFLCCLVAVKYRISPQHTSRLRPGSAPQTFAMRVSQLFAGGCERG